MSTDRNLLLGILAYQLNFVSSGQLIEAMDAWVLDKAEPLEKFLLDQSALTEDTCSVLVDLVATHLKLHDNSAENSLASLSSIGSLRDDLLAVSDSSVERTLTFVAQKTHVPESSYAVGEATVQGLRFKVLRPHAKGGLGQVSVALDSELNREVALKEIQPNHADNADSRSRFVQEAEVTGGLEHPGIVPVYGLGQASDGRPFYAMRFIRGDSLKEAIDRYHKSDKRDANQRNLEFRQLLGRFVDVCNAIEYAHSRGVLHRDLKPGNIMLGKYGETLVVDWGLAKVLGKSEMGTDCEEPTLRPAAASGSTPTLMGHALGTPAFMPPEQAAGRLGELGPASDVYSLGATLYYLLTGRRPISGESLEDVLNRVCEGSFSAPRSVAPEIPKSLEAVCLRAMAMKPAHRYASPQELAEDVERFLADEPVSVFTEPIVLRAQRWVRKHQTIAATTAAVLLVSLMALGVSTTVVSGKNAELAKKNSALTEANGSARRQSQLALTTLTSVIEDIQAGLPNLPGSSDVRRRLLRTSLSKLESVAVRFVEQSKVDLQTAVALGEIGNITLEFGASEVEMAMMTGETVVLSPEQTSASKLASVMFQRAIQIAEKLSTEDPGDVRVQLLLADLYGHLGDIERLQGNLQAHMDYCQKSVKISKTLDTKGVLASPMAFVRLGDAYLNMGGSTDALASFQIGLRIARTNLAADPDSLVAQAALTLALKRMGNAYVRLGEPNTALEWLQKALKRSVSLAGQDPENVRNRHKQLMIFVDIGDVKLTLGDVPSALLAYEKSLEACQKLVEDYPGSEVYQHQLLVLYKRLGDLELRAGKGRAALSWYQKSRSIADELAALDHYSAMARQNLAAIHRSTGDALRPTDPRSALVEYQKGLAVLEKLAAEDDTNVDVWHSLSGMHNQIGSMQMMMGNEAAALSSYRKGLEINRELVAKDPESARANRALAISHSFLGDVKLQSGDPQSASESFLKCIEISERLDANDSTFDTRRDLASSYYASAQAQFWLQEFGEALNWYQKCLKIREGLTASDAKNADVLHNLAVLHEKMGDCHEKLKVASSALASYEKGLKVVERVVAVAPNRILAQELKSILHQKVGDIQLFSEHDHRGARRSFEKALATAEKLANDHPEYVPIRTTLTVLHERFGQLHSLATWNLTAALSSYQKCLGIRKEILANEPANAIARRNLAAAHYQLFVANRTLGDHENAAKNYEASASILRKMVDDGVNVNDSKDMLAFIEEIAGDKKEPLALGAWDDLLKQPTDSLPELLELRARRFSQRSRHAEAARAAHELRQIEAADEKQLYTAARVFARCAGSINAADGEEFTAEQANQREAWKANALSALKQAIGAGWRDFDEMRMNPDLTLLQDSPEFKALLPEPEAESQ